MLLQATLVFLALCSANAQVKYSTIIAVYNSTHDTNVMNCSSGTNAQYNINELPLKNITSGTLLRLCSNSFVLTKNLLFELFLENIALVGYNFPTIKCENEHMNVGITFGNIHHLELHNFTVIGCGVDTTIDTKADHNIKASVVILNSTGINVTGVNITKSPGTGLALFYNNGSINLEKCVFELSGLDKKTGGNGVYVETGPPLTVFRGLVADYSFIDCHFLFNKAVTGKDSIIKGFSRFDKGGGLCIYVLLSESVNFTISNSLFVGNEADHYGGGLFVTYIGKAQDNNVRVLKSEFLCNKAQFGGAMYAGYLHTRVPFATPLNCSHIYESLNITQNVAQFGGGSSVFASKTLSKTNNIVNFVNCAWTRNFGQYGSAIAVLPNAWNLYTEGYLPTPRFIGCTIASNEVNGSTIFTKGNYAEYSKGSGAFYCFGHNVSFEELTLIEDNKGSGMYLGSCLAIFHKNSITYFVNNTGYQGGAIYELSSVVYVQDNSTVYFSANSAEDKGGAIYEHTFFMHVYDYSKTCFIDYVDNIEDVIKRNIMVTFIDNFAGKSGHSIHASSLRPCYNRFSFSAANLSVDIFDQVGNFTYYPENRPYEISTAINHSNITAEDWTQNLFFIPGKSMKLPFVDIDDLEQKVRTNYLVTIHPNDSVTTPSDYADITSNVLLLYGKGAENATITLSDTSSRQIALTFNITMEECPPGFIHDDESQACACSVNSGKSYLGIETCKESLMRAYSKYGYWVGYLSNETESEDSLISAYYPTEQISESNHHMLPKHADRQLLDALMCDKSRTGFLCSQCKDNLTVHYHSWKFACKTDRYCSIGWLFYILSEIVPITIIFVFIIVFNISLTSGLVNGFMFYCQVIGVIHLVSSNYLPFSPAAQVINKIHSFVYLSTSLYLFNLEDLSFCLWKDANPLSLAAFNNVSLLYAFILIFVVTFAARNCSYGCCSCRCKCLSYTSIRPTHQSSSGIIHGLVAFLLLCYAQCGHSSLPLLLSVDVYRGGPTYLKTMVYFQPDIEWLSTQHLPYVLVSSLLIFFILFLPPTLLLMYPLHYKVLSFCRIAEFKYIQVLFSPLEKLKPFFDSFQSCFKDEFRFFSGLYFVYRLVMFVILANTSAQMCFFLIEIQLVIMLTLHAICQPYKKRLHNVIDTLLFCNLAIINAIIYYNVTTSTSSVGELNLSATLWLQIVLVCLPLPFILAFVLAHTPCVRACRREQTSRSDSHLYQGEDFLDRLNYHEDDD